MTHMQHSMQLSPERYSDEESQAVLPTGCSVQVTGNNRTKLSLLGQRGVIIQAGDLGGWHTLVLESGEQVRLQRNALTVLEYPNGSGVVRDTPNDANHGALLLSSHTRAPQTQDRQTTSSAGYRTSPPGYSGYMEPVKQSMKRVGKTRVNFDQLGNNALRKYRMHYNLNEVGPHSPRMDLVSAIEKHFSEQVVDEQMVMAALLEALHRRR